MSDYFGKGNRFEFGHILVEILQMYTMHSLAHRPQVSKSLNVYYLCYRHASFFAFFIFNKFPAINAFQMCVEYDKTKQTPSNKM